MTEEAKRGPGRPPMRAKDEDSLARARERAAKLRENKVDDNDFNDRFMAPPAPEGWTYQWKRHLLMGAEDPAYEVRLAEAGWEPVPASRHPNMMPIGYAGTTIERDGMILMERPAEIEEEVRTAEHRRARRQLNDKVDQLNNAPSGQFERTNKGNSMLKVKSSFERMAVPEE